jgi:hypothetical protein
MNNFAATVRTMREAAGGWGIAWAVWVLLAVVVQGGVMAYQGSQPGPYDSPEKAELRRNVNLVFSVGIIGLMIPCLQSVRRWQEARTNLPEETTRKQ